MSEPVHSFSYPDVSFLTQAKLQAQVIVPVLRALREKIGTEEADALVREALSDWSKLTALQTDNMYSYTLSASDEFKLRRNSR